MSIDYQHPEYAKQKYFWDIVSDVMSDDERRLHKYLRTINPQDDSEANKRLNDAYKLAAAWYGYTSQTVAAMLGSVYRKWPSLDLPDAMDYLANNADGSGMSIYQLSQGSVNDTLTRGRGGVYVTFPQTQGQVSRADMQSGKYVATVHRIEPEQIINWRVGQFGSQAKLTLVVFVETFEKDAEFLVDTYKRYRELRLVNGVYFERTWTDVGGSLTIKSEHFPTDATGATWDHIPFTFLGSETNDESVDKIPIFPLAKMNLKHYQNSADNEESTFFGVQNQPFINTTEINADTFKEMKELGVYFGNRELLPFPVGIAASAENLQVAKEMERKVLAMEALGARLSTANQAAKTAAQVHGEREGQTSVLAMIASNVSEAYTQAIRWACRYMGVDDSEVSFTLNQDFVNMGMDAQLLQVIFQGWQMGNVPTADYVRIMKRMEIFDDDKPIEEYAEELTARAMIE